MPAVLFLLLQIAKAQMSQNDVSQRGCAVYRLPFVCSGLVVRCVVGVVVFACAKAAGPTSRQQHGWLSFSSLCCESQDGMRAQWHPSFLAPVTATSKIARINGFARKQEFSCTSFQLRRIITRNLIKQVVHRQKKRWLIWRQLPRPVRGVGGGGGGCKTWGSEGGKNEG